MKKLLIAISGVALMLTASCGGRSVASNPQNVELGDSLATALGQLIGAQQLQQYKYMMEQAPESEKKNFKKEEFIKGMAAVLNTDSTNTAYLMGLSMGLRVWGNVYMQAGEAGVTVDPAKVIAAMKEVYLKDSTDLEMPILQQNMQSVSMRLQELAQEKRENEIRESEEYKANTQAGEKAATDSVAAGFQRSESGLVYRVENQGTGDKLKGGDTAQIRYVGKHLNGEVFDQSPAEGRRFNINGVVPGFKEGLEMLGKGGTATLVIPGDLGYGLNGAQGAGIGPNETLVFEVTVLEVNPEK